MSGFLKTKTALLKTSSANDVKVSGGTVSITGLYDFRRQDVVNIRQIMYKAEVSQVVKVGGGSWTPAGGTKYNVILVNPAFGQFSNQLATEKVYHYTTPIDITELGATAALQREAIHGYLVTALNADARNYISSVSLGTGTGFTITDDAGYFPGRVNGTSNGRQGATIVKATKNIDGSGWADATVTSITTAAVYSYGVGARLIQDTPSYSYMTGGNLISGEIDAPVAADGTYAVSGQQYNGFSFNVLRRTEIPTIGHGIQGFHFHEQLLFVDNGAGTSTANATGYGTFEKAMLRVIFSRFKDDPNAIIEFFDNRPVFSGVGTAGIPVGTNGGINTMQTKNNELPYLVIGTSTQIFPLWDATNGSGLILDLDNAAEGLEFAAQPLGTASQEFVVGQQEFSLYYKGTITDVSQSNPFYVGFRKKQAFDATLSNYTDYAALGFNASAATQAIKTLTNLASAGEVATATTKTWADTATHVLEVRVLSDGSVKFYVDNVDVTSVQVTAFSFAAGTTVIPFVRAVGTGSGAPTNTANIVAVLPSAYWKIN